MWIFDILDGNFTINKINILDGKFPNPCLTQARYISTYRIVERGYGWSGRECRTRRNSGEREKEKGLELEREGGMVTRERGKKARS